MPTSSTTTTTVPTAAPDPATVATLGGDDASADASWPRSATPAQLEQQIQRAGRRLHRARCQLLAALAAYDRSGHWAFTGAPTCAHWVAVTLDVRVGTAREWLRIAHALDGLASVRVAFSEGRLSYASVRMLTRIAVDHPERQDELVGLAAGVAAADLGPLLARWCVRNEDDRTRERRHRRHTHLSTHVDADGMATLVARLPVVLMGAVQAAIDTRVMQGRAKAPDQPDADHLSLGHQRALALVDLLTDGDGARVLTEVIVHVRSDGCSLHDGTPIADNAVAALIDEAFLRVLIHDAEGHPINASGRQRHPHTRQRRVVDERQPCCVDCGGTDLLEYDHDPEFAVSRHTVIDELYRRCWRCHRARHAGTSAAR
jgi:hypothetical protein